MKVSLIVSTYNRPNALRVCLDSIFQQTHKPDEIIIGDDGSKDDTRLMIGEMQKTSPVPLIHLWHEDQGFRLAKMRNKCIAKASSEYIIEIDGDIFLHPQFVEDHIRLARKGYFLKGGRVNLGLGLTEGICAKGVYRPINPWSYGIESKPENTIHSKWLSAYLASRYRKNKTTVLGCNISFFKEDILRINGYDENFEGWGCEDEDLANRLFQSGCKKRYLKFAGIVYHLWHEDKFMQNHQHNLAYMKKQLEKKIVACDRGINQYL